MYATDYGQQLMVQIWCTFNWQELKGRHNDTINYHEVTCDGMNFKILLYHIKLFHVKNSFLEKSKIF